VKRFVLDASVALAWFIDRPMAPYAARVKQRLLDGDRAVVPALWRLEIANGLVVSERRRILMPSDTAEILQSFDLVLAQCIENSEGSIPMRRVIATAREFRLTAYDAEYLDLARDQQLSIATLDRGLEEAAVRAGVRVLR
jgi:predicted nucleic acid-binding protein